MTSSSSSYRSREITFFLASLRGGGAERVMLTIINEFASRGCKVDLVLLRAEGPYIKDVHESVTLVNIGANRALFSLPFMIRYFMRNKPRIVLSALPHINMIACVAQRLSFVKSRIVITEHNTLSKSVMHATTIRGRWLPIFMRLIYPLAHTIIAVSNGVAEDLSTVLALPKSRISVIYNPVVTKSLKQQAEIPVTHTWLQSDRIPVVLGVGRLTKAKNFETLIQAFSIVLETISAKLIILGEGEERSNLENLVRQLNLVNEVDLPGFTENPYSYMKRAKLFVLSSLWEGLPTVLIEALSCGTQVVSTDCPSGPREILENGKWGTLVAVNDGQALANAMIDAIKNPSYFSNPESWSEYTLKNILLQYEKILL